MTRQAAKAFYDVQAGDPATGYITPADAQAALDVVYDDMATAGAVPRITGSPEGVRVGNPGDEVIQTDASARDVKGWLRWVKATGTGNTGWVAGPEADTGWRNLVTFAGGAVTSGAFATTDWGPNATNAGSVKIRRIGGTVYLRLNWVEAKVANPTGGIVAWPAGFGDNTVTPVVAAPIGTGLLNTMLGPGAAGIYRVTGTVAVGDNFGRFSSLTLSWPASSPWPSSLPGTPA